MNKIRKYASAVKQALIAFDQIISGWKRIIAIFGLFATVICLAVLNEDLDGIAKVVTAIGVAFGGFGFTAFAAKKANS